MSNGQGRDCLTLPPVRPGKAWWGRFRRDPTQWAQVLIFTAIMVLYFANMRQFFQGEFGRSYQNGISQMNLAATALLMWMPVCGPLPEVRLSLPGQMFYLFLQTIIPTIPSAWLIFAERPVYHAYDTSFRLWGLDAVTDQQIAGVMMKLGEAFYIWGLILVLFFKWSSRHMEAERAGVLVSERDVLTWEEVRTELDELARHGPPAPPEPS